MNNICVHACTCLLSSLITFVVAGSLLSLPLTEVTFTLIVSFEVSSIIVAFMIR